MRPRLRVRMICQGCDRGGRHAFGSPGRPGWCRCVGTFGPIVAAPGTVVELRFDSLTDASFHERCRRLGQAYHDAKDNLTDRWVRCGRGWRELPSTSRKRILLEADYEHALAMLEAAQAECPHLERSLFAPEYCGVCYAHVECDVAQYRHLLREAGEDFTRRIYGEVGT